MKIAFTSSGDRLDSALDARFGRAKKFLIYDTNTTRVEVIDNQQNLDAVQGAGVQAAETIVGTGAQCLITGHCGPKAFRVLSAANIKVYHTQTLTVAQALEDYQAGKLVEAKSADVDGHWA